jgi:hypothetical protein
MFAESVCILERRSHAHREDPSETSDCSVDDIFKIRRKPDPNYIGPSQRIDETKKHRDALRKAVEKEREEQFQVDCPFHPVILYRSYRPTTDTITKHSDHCHCLDVAELKPRRFMSQNSKRILAEAKPKPEKPAPIEPAKTSKYSAGQIKKTIDRLSRPRVVEEAEDVEEPRKVDMNVINRLVTDSCKRKKPIERVIPSNSDEVTPEMAEKAQKRRDDLYAESIIRVKEREKEMKNARRYKEMMEISECTFQPDIERLPMPLGEKLAHSLIYRNKADDREPNSKKPKFRFLKVKNHPIPRKQQEISVSDERIDEILGEAAQRLRDICK